MAGKTRLEEYADIVYWLNGYRRAIFHTQCLKEEIIRWEAKAQKTTPSTSQAVSTGGAITSAVALALEMVEATEERLEAAKESRDNKRIEIENAIMTLPKDSQQKVLYCLYIDMLLQCEVAQKLNYSKRQIIRIHTDALEELKRCPPMSP